MKTLVVYYSRTGLTRKVANHIASGLKADVDEIIDSKNRSGPIGYMRAGKDAMKGALTKIKFEKNPKDYDAVIIGGPVWAWTVTPAVRTYLDNNSDALKIKKVAFFATQGSAGAEKKFEEMQKILHVKPVATAIVNGKDFKDDAFKEKVKNVISALKP